MEKLIYTMRPQEVRKHVFGVKIIRENRLGIDFIVGGETHSTWDLNKFCFAACYLGFVFSERTGFEKVSLPVSMVWEMVDFASPLQTDVEFLRESHKKLLEHADKLLTDGNIYQGGECRRKLSVRFNLRGKDVAVFKEQLRLSLHFGVDFH